MFVSKSNRKGKQLLLSRRIIKIYHGSIEPRDIVVGEMKTELNEFRSERERERERNRGESVSNFSFLVV